MSLRDFWRAFVKAHVVDDDPKWGRFDQQLRTTRMLGDDAEIVHPEDCEIVRPMSCDVDIDAVIRQEGL